MEQHRIHGFINMNSIDEPPTFYARRCSITGEGMNAGYCILDGDMYIKKTEDLVRHLRENFQDIIEGHSDYDCDAVDFDLDSLTDDEVMQECADTEYYYYTEWTEEDIDEEDLELQKACFIMELNGFNVDIDGDQIALTAWNNELDLSVEVYVQRSEISEWARYYDERVK